MTIRVPSPKSPSPPMAAIGLALLSTLAVASALLLLLCSQIVAQRPARQGVMAVHLGQDGTLRLWNQPIRPQDLPLLLERARSRSKAGAPVVVRLIPEAQVPWGMVHLLLTRLQPPAAGSGWILQLQLP